MKKKCNWMKFCAYICSLFSLLFSLQTELSHNLQHLSEKARSTTEFIQRLKGMSDKVTVSLLLCVIIITLLGKHEFNFTALLCSELSISFPSKNMIFFFTLLTFCWRKAEKTSKWNKIIMETFHSIHYNIFAVVVDVKPIFHFTIFFSSMKC